MKFKLNDCVTVNTPRLSNPAFGFVRAVENSPFGPAYDIELQDYPDIGEIKGVTEDVMTLHVRKAEEPGQPITNLGLEKTLTEILKLLERGEVSLSESIIKHDYHAAAGKHFINIDLSLNQEESAE